MMCYCRLLNAYLICTILIFSVSSSFGHDLIHVGPHIEMTHGEVWPKPMLQKNGEEYFKLEPGHFNFNITGHNCYNLQEAIKRYKSILFLKAKHTSTCPKKNCKTKVVGMLNVLNVHLESTPCEDYPSLEMDEEYKININQTGGTLSAYSIWGIIRGLETFSQLVSLEETDDGPTFVVRYTSIQDCPKFKHRGFLLDTARHFIPVLSILNTLDAMSYSKLNVFHWHMVDDQSFPFQSSAFPDLSAKGAYGDSAVYTKDDVELVIEYAKLRGIRVIPEFDTPGHTLSWGLGGIPGLLSKCSDPTRFVSIDPTIKENYQFISALLTEISELFQDQCLHLGGDDIDKSCWLDNEKILAFMLRMDLCDFSKLQNFYFKNIFNITDKLKAVPIVWQDVFDARIDMDPNVIVQVWKNNYVPTILEVLRSGHRVVVSSCWHMDCVHYGPDWLRFYRCDLSKIADRNGLILGGEGCLWGEFVDEANLFARSWPNLCAVAEALWSHAHDEVEAASRLEEHVCRMRRRGIPARPANGPHYCYY